MVDFSTDHTTARFGRDTWQHDNDRGLALAADGDWAEATEAFAAAADSLARALPSASGSHEPLALVLSNLAQANFRLGRVEEALQHAQRVCALRVALAGEDAMPVARARMDLAVMLASSGRLDEARLLVQRAITAIEHHVGEEDARLAIVLENAARIALAAGNPANAEPLLLRLHALLDAHELSTERAEVLLARVADVRARQEAAASRHEVEQPLVTDDMSADAAVVQVTAAAAEDAQVVTPRSETPAQVSAFDDDTSMRVYAHASIEAHEEWEDQPLRDAVAVTDVLLRTTPSGVPIIPAAPVVEPPSLDQADDLVDEMLDTMDLTDVLPAPTLRDPSIDELLSVDVMNTPLSSLAVAGLDRTLTPLEPFDAVPAAELDVDLLDTTPAADALSGLSLDLADSAPVAQTAGGDTDFDLDLAFDDEVVPADTTATAVEAPAATSNVNYPTPATNAGLLLDFAVEHGVVNADEEPMLVGPPISSPVLGGLPDQPAVPAAPAVKPGPTQIVSSGSTAGIAPLSDIVATAPPAPSMAAPSPEPVPTPRASSTGAAPRRTTESRAANDAQPSSGKGKLFVIIGGVVAVAGGAAAFFLLK
ncbi:tetratricopeptide repeat protein [Gemmatimonas phototrophica]|uniref:MalT-like TPR region domain-containing protein n=1 Tax=Gemmatimonas phototrophica TaxID=1379270 RepID=A0A143BKY0_9BACT|nr:tetratricopeptide repeat protein [Gemmatimonas phototrophica]AMW05201.1 hypothetical protein GEMMAAP_11025 [Gemmatimonas phototrophica]